MNAMKALMAWTVPLCGVSHRETDLYLCTIVTYQYHTEAVVYRKPVRIADGVDRMFATSQEAMEWCDQLVAEENKL